MSEPKWHLLLTMPVVGIVALRLALLVVAGVQAPGTAGRREVYSRIGWVILLAWAMGMAWFTFERLVLKPWNWTATPAVMVLGVLVGLPIAFRLPWWVLLAVWAVFVPVALGGLVAYDWCWQQLGAP